MESSLYHILQQSNNSTNSTNVIEPVDDLLDEEVTAAERGGEVEGDLQEAFGAEGMSGKEMFMWYSVYALIQAVLAISLQFFQVAQIKKFYWQAIMQVAAFLPIGLLWVLSLIFMNDLTVAMIETALDLSLVSPFIVHWVGFGMLTVGVMWTDWLDITLWVSYLIYGIGEVLLAMMFAPAIFEWLESDPLTTSAAEQIEESFEEADDEEAVDFEL